MSLLEQFRAAFEGLRQSVEANRVAHAYLFIGPPRGAGLKLAESFLQLLFCREGTPPCGRCGQCGRIERHEHPDIVWIEPQLKSRQISAETLREIIGLMCRKSYEGGWKAAVILHADRMTDAAANAFLKTLEEPAGDAVLILLTDMVQNVRPTIVSRCQRVVLGTERASLRSAPWYNALLDLLRHGTPRDALQARCVAAAIKALLDQSAARIEELLSSDLSAGDPDGSERNARISAGVHAERAQMLQVMLMWKRDVLFAKVGAGRDKLFFAEEADTIFAQAAGASYCDVLREVQGVQWMAEQIERNLPAETIMVQGLMGVHPGQA